MRTLRTLAAAALLLGTIGTARASADLYVLHGIPNTPVDVYVNYEPGASPVLSNFLFESIVGPVTLPAGTYKIDIFLAGQSPSATSPVISSTATLTDGQNVSAIAHLTEGGAPTLSYFGLDLRATDKRGSRIGLRHTAAAPAVDVVLAAGKFVKKDGSNVAARVSFNNGGGVSTDVPYGPYQAYLTLPGGNDRIFPPAAPLDLFLDAGKIYYAYAVGVFPDSFTLLLQVLEPKKSGGGPGPGNGDDDDDDDVDDDDDDDDDDKRRPAVPDRPSRFRR